MNDVLQATRPAIIRKDLRTLPVPPNFTDYEYERAAFSWTAAREALQGLPGGGLNIAWEAVERHARGRLKDKTAIRWLGQGGRTMNLTYGGLSLLSNRFAGALRALGVRRGERVFLLAGRIPALYVAILGALKNGCVVCPLFSAFGPEPVRTRLTLGEGSVLITTESLFRRKIAPILGTLSHLRHIMVISEWGPPPPGTHDFWRFVETGPVRFETEHTAPEDVALLHFTSGTTGAPKGAVHVHAAAVAHYVTGRYALDLHTDDIFWCTADPGWVTGMSYGVIAPLLHGVTSIVDEAEFDPVRWYEILARERVSVWYTAPTAIRMLMKAGPELAHVRRFEQLRFIASVGEPLNAEAVWWGFEVLGLPIHDNWWQTETGGIMIANTPAFDIRPGSMGRPLPGVDACIVQRRHDGAVAIVDEPNVDGELALKTGWPSLFRGYLGQDERYRKCFAGDLYLTGDLARRDADGYYWFVGRADDVIKSAGHLIDPFEVENVLMEHPAVAEAGVIGKPDPTVGETVKAFVSLKDGFVADDGLRLELIGHARRRLGAAVAPKEIAFLDALPRTRSGKIMRRLLKARELGLPEGDLSTLEAGA